MLSKELEELEQKYLTCEQNSEPSAQPATKRGRKRKSDQAFEKKAESSSAMAELAASLQISHFHKVCELAQKYLVIRLIFRLVVYCKVGKIVLLIIIISFHAAPVGSSVARFKNSPVFHFAMYITTRTSNSVNSN